MALAPQGAGSVTGIVSTMREAVIVGGARTPVGRLLGSLSGFTGADLGGLAIKAALERAALPPDRVEYVIMGQVLQAGGGQIPAPQAARGARVPLNGPSVAVNKDFLSRPGGVAPAPPPVKARRGHCR